MAFWRDENELDTYRNGAEVSDSRAIIDLAAETMSQAGSERVATIRRGH